MFEMDEETKATVDYKRAMTVDKLVGAGVMDEEEAREWFGNYFRIK
ncbi:MAG: hypothetical protein ACOCT7_02480 [Candidatus Saliniplasma sp.]